MAKYVMALDAGTTSNRCILFNEKGEMCSVAQREFTQYFPKPGWVEHDPLELWQRVMESMSMALSEGGVSAEDVACIGIDNQGETVMLWDKITGAPVYNAIVWQDRRMARYADELTTEYGELIRENYENLRKHNEEIQTLRHDLRHHVTALQGLCREGDMGEIQKYLESLSQRPELNRSNGYTVHPAVDTVLTAMLARGTETGVRAEVRVELPPELPIPNSDLCPLLMNLLDNALEANEKAPEGAEKWLRVTMHLRGEYLYVGVENARFAPVNFDPEEGLYNSTKPGTLHGMGLKSARATARKYHSELVLKAIEDSFSASTALLLPKTEA